MLNNSGSSVSSRREFLKKAVKTTGYVLPLVMVMKMGSVNAWAESYGRTTQDASGGTRRTHDGFFDQLGRFFSNLFHS